MRCKALFLATVGVAVLLLSGCNNTAKISKAIKEGLNLDYVYYPPNDAHGPGTVFWVEGRIMQPACEPSQTLSFTPIVKKFNIANVKTSSNKEISVDVSIKGSDKEFLKNVGVDEKYHNITKLNLKFENGHQYELYKDETHRVGIASIFNGLKNADCHDELTTILLENPKAKFFLANVVYGYDVKYEIETSTGQKFDVKIPEEVLKVLNINLGIDYNASTGTLIGGNGLFVGSNGSKIEKSISDLIGATSKISAFTIDTTELVEKTKALMPNDHPSIDITEEVKLTVFKRK